MLKVIHIKKKKVTVCCLKLGAKNLVLAVTKHGYIGCGYIDIAAAEKFSDTACIVKGVATVRDLLRAPVVAVTSRARAKGIQVGMSGQEIIECYL